MKRKIKELKEQANELIDSGNSKEKAKGYGMLVVIAEWEKFNPMELLKPVILEMTHNKIKRSAAVEKWLYNDDGTYLHIVQMAFDKLYDELYNKLNVF